MKTKEFTLQVKNLSDAGTFEGYGSIFGNVDSYNEIVAKGAFEKSLNEHKQNGTNVVMLWQHDRRSPIGIWKELREDDLGLVGKGEINLEVQQGREAYSLMKQGALTGLSIGYEEIDVNYQGDHLILNELKLHEISPVTFPANDAARISAVKAKRLEDFAQRLRDNNPMTPKEFEELLREAGVPKSKATQIASVGYAKAIRSESDSCKANDAMVFLKALSNN